MSSEQLEAERKAFEYWITATSWFKATTGIQRSGDEYSDPLVNSRWQGWQAARSQPAEGMVMVTKDDGNNYCLILTALGMEEEGDPVAEVKRLVSISEQPAAPRVVSDGVYVSRHDLLALLDGNLEAADVAIRSTGGIDFIEEHGGSESEDLMEQVAYHLFYSLHAGERLRAAIESVAPVQPSVPVAALKPILSALDIASGDSDPNIDPDMTDDELRQEYPEIWAMRQLTQIIAAHDGKGE